MRPNLTNSRSDMKIWIIRPFFKKRMPVTTLLENGLFYSFIQDISGGGGGGGVGKSSIYRFNVILLTASRKL